MTPRPQPDPVDPGQESVWSYPRPPAVRACGERIQVVLGGVTVADTTSSWQVLETSHPPNYYLPRSSFAPGSLRPASGHSFCEWKGVASYVDLVGGSAVAAGAGWYYPTPVAAYGMLVDHIALYAGRMDSCRVGGELVTPQPGGFYGGWVTASVVGPFKGGPGSSGW